MVITLTLTVLFMNAGRLGVQAVSAAVGYASRLFDTSAVHSIDIVMNDWDSFIENCSNEEYADCTVIIDGEAYRNVAIRAKGNTSLTSVESYGNSRYSFKIEFDHYDDAINYYGLDKLCLNNIIQDNTYMKDYLTYRLMREFGADAPLCSYSYITVNGEDWGLYLAVEGIEDSFLQRSYGNDHGQLYKPDSTNMGGGRGNGREFDMNDFRSVENTDTPSPAQTGKPETASDHNFAKNERSEFIGEKPGSSEPTSNIPSKRNGQMPAEGNGFENRNGSSDVSLIYTDDDYDSYSNIFDNAKTSLTDTDKTRLIESIKKLNNNEDIEDVVNIEEVIRYFVVHNYVLNFDSYTGDMIHNYYLYEQDGQLSMIPWDYNLAFGGFKSQIDTAGLVNYPIDTPVSGGTVDSRPMLAWIFNNETYTDLYHQYFTEFIAEFFDNDYFENLLDSTKEMIAPYVESDPTKFCTYEEFENGVSTLKRFCLLRAESISGQLDGTIPSTSDGQSADSSSLITADGLVISDMGSMDHMMGGGFARNNRHADMVGGQGDAIEAFNPMTDDFDSADNPPPPNSPDADDGTMPSDHAAPSGDFTPPDMSDIDNRPAPSGSFTPPDMPGTNTAGNVLSLTLLGISTGILLLGIGFAFIFKRRR